MADCFWGEGRSPSEPRRSLLTSFHVIGVEKDRGVAAWQ